MLGEGDQRRMSIDGESSRPLPINYSRPLVISQPSTEPSSPYLRDDVQEKPIAKYIQKLEDELKEVGAKIKHHEHNVRYLKFETHTLDDSILDLQVSIGKYHTTRFPKGENEVPSSSQSEEETIQSILKYGQSAAAIFYGIKIKPEYQAANLPWMKDVLGVVATLGKVDDPNLSRLLSEYLGMDTMLAVVCKTYEGVEALEAYGKDGKINKGLGIHALAASTGKTLDDRFLVICLENLRPYTGEFIDDDPQRRFDLVKPKLKNGETPPGFLGFAINMITIDTTDLNCVTETGYSLRETLFYNIFSNLQVYESRKDMLKACPFITHAAISLDGGIIRSPGVFSLGHQQGDVGVKFPRDSKRLKLPNYYEIENQLKEIQWKKKRMQEDMNREQELLDHAMLKFESKKQEFLQLLTKAATS